MRLNRMREWMSRAVVIQLLERTGIHRCALVREPTGKRFGAIQGRCANAGRTNCDNLTLDDVARRSE